MAGTRASGGRPTRNSSGQFVKKKPVTHEQQHGAQVLLQKPVTTKIATETSQYVNVEQSLHLVQTVLHGCLASILFQRSLYPAGCYETRWYTNEGPDYKYSECLGGQDPDQSSARPPAGNPIFSLKKGASERTDRLLDLLENGVFDALNRGYLKSLHLSIFEDEQSPTDVLEVWTLTIDYIPGSDSPLIASGFNITDQKGTATKVTLSRAKSSLNEFIRQLTNMSSAMPSLPAQKFISFEVAYTEDTPDGYRAPGFHRPVYESVRFPSNEDWEKVTTQVGILHTGHHIAGLKVSHLHALNPNIGDTLPQGLECTMETPKTDDVLPDLRERATALLRPHPNAKASRRVDLSPSEDDAMLDVHTPQPNERGSKPVRLSTRDQHEREQLRQMLSAPTRVSHLQATQIVDTASPEMQEEEAAAQLIIKQAKLDELAREADATQTSLPERVVILTSHQHLEAITVGCICDQSGEEGDMVQCGYCGLFQHLHCHGFTDKNETRLPAVHVCYSCLLSGEEDSLRRLQQQALIRRALYFLQKGSFENSKSFSRALGCAEKTVADIKKELKKCGLLATNLGSSMKDKQRVALSRSPAAIGVMKQKFFDPTFVIAHHLEDSADKEERSSVTISNTKRAHENEDPDMLSAKRLKQAHGSYSLNAEMVHTPKASRHQYI